MVQSSKTRALSTKLLSRYENPLSLVFVNEASASLGEPPFLKLKNRGKSGIWRQIMPLDMEAERKMANSPELHATSISVTYKEVSPYMNTINRNGQYYIIKEFSAISSTSYIVRKSVEKSDKLGGKSVADKGSDENLKIVDETQSEKGARKQNRLNNAEGKNELLKI